MKMSLLEFIIAVVGWLLVPIAIVVVSFEVAKCWVEDRIPR